MNTSLNSVRKFTLALAAVSLLAPSAWATMVWQWNPLTANHDATTAGEVSFSARSVDALDTESRQDANVSTRQVAYTAAPATEDSFNVLAGLHLQNGSSSGGGNALQVDLSSVLDQFDDSGMEGETASTLPNINLSRSHAIASANAQAEASFVMEAQNRAAAAPTISVVQNAPAHTAEHHMHAITYASDIRAVPEMSAFFPIIGLLAAIGSTHFLRRRRMAQLARTRASF